MKIHTEPVQAGCALTKMNYFIWAEQVAKAGESLDPPAVDAACMLLPVH